MAEIYAYKQVTNCKADSVSDVIVSTVAAMFRKHFRYFQWPPLDDN